MTRDLTDEEVEKFGLERIGPRKYKSKPIPLQKWMTPKEIFRSTGFYSMDGFAGMGEEEQTLCFRLAEQYADQFAYHLLQWFIEEEMLGEPRAVGIHPTGTDIESYIHDFKESLK